MMTQHQLISDRYVKQQQLMHADGRKYGKHGDVWASTVADVATRYGAGSILDYGAGRGRLSVALREAGFVCRDYDPAVVVFSGRPSFADLVTCTDVMEHVEPNRLEAVLTHIRQLARKAAFFVISTRPAQKCLPNGDNAHLIIQSADWWRDRIVTAGFTVQDGPSVWPAKRPASCWVGVVTP